MPSSLEKLWPGGAMISAPQQCLLNKLFHIPTKLLTIILYPSSHIMRPNTMCVGGRLHMRLSHRRQSVI